MVRKRIGSGVSSLRIRSAAPLAVLLLAAASGACGDLAPASPTPSGPPVERAIEVRANVFDSASVPVTGATVSVVMPTGQAVSASTDTSGRASLMVTAFSDAVLQVTAAKEGYRTTTRAATVPRNGSPGGLSILLPSVSPFQLTDGSYDLTIVPAASCPAFPAGFAPRTYAATWRGASGELYLSGTFIDGFAQVRIWTSADFVRLGFSRPDGFDDGPMGEVLEGQGAFSFYGEALGRVPAQGVALDVPLAAEIGYCPRAGAPAAECVRCSSTLHRVTLVPR